jgi:hypothetical protein
LPKAQTLHDDEIEVFVCEESHMALRCLFRLLTHDA